MYEGIIVELPLAAFFLKKLRDSSSDLNDLPSLDRQLYANLMKLTDPNLDLDSVGVHFTIMSTVSGDDVEVPLMPGMQQQPKSSPPGPSRIIHKSKDVVVYICLVLLHRNLRHHHDEQHE